MSSCGTDWQNQDGMTEHTISDDGNVQVPIPFNFPYGYNGNNFTTSWMFSNGVVGFMSPTGSFCCNGTDVANGDWTNYTGLPYFSYSIAALWTDLIDLNVDYDGDGIDDTGFFTHEVDTDGDGSVDTLRYLWRNISEFYNQETKNTFGVEIDTNGGIEIHHFEIDIRNHNVTVGVFGDVTNGEISQYEYHAQGYQNDTYTMYTFDLENACKDNPLISPVCSGYEEAYAEVVYNQQCAANPLYDIGCTGYDQAYYDQQCQIDPLYDSGCSGYTEAYYGQQCSLDPLYDIGCDGYEVAYLEQQCELNQLYDTQCPLYEQTYYETYVLPGLEEIQNDIVGNDSTDPTQIATETQDDFLVSDPVESITSVEVTGDAQVDEILRGNNDVATDIVVMDFGSVEMESVETGQDFETIETGQGGEPEQEPQTEIEVIAELEMELDEPNETESESSGDVEEPVGGSGDEESSEPEQGSEGSSEDGDKGEAESSEQTRDAPTKEQKQESKRKKLKQIATKKAMQLANRMASAATLEAQQAVQLQVLRLMGFNPDFSAYQDVTITEQTFYADEQLPDAKIPNSRRGLRNGLAQQLLHEKMVDMQWK